MANRDLRWGVFSLLVSACCAVAVMAGYLQLRDFPTLYDLFLYAAVPTVLALSFLRPQAGFAALVFFIVLSPTEWADGVPILSYEYPYLKPGLNVFDGLLLAASLGRLTRIHAVWKPGRSFMLIFMAYVVLAMVSVQFSTYFHSSRSVYSLYILLDLARMLLIVWNLTAFRREHFEKVNVLLLGASFVLALFMFTGQAVANPENRLSTLGLGPNGVGGFFPLLIPLTLVYAKSRFAWYRIGGVSGFVLLWAGLLLSQSRSGIAAAAVGTGLMYLILAENKRRAGAILAAAAAAALLMFSKLTLLSRFSTDSDNGRVDLWGYAFQYLQDHVHVLLFGLGPGMFYDFALNYLGVHLGSSPEHAHNYLITRLMENGLPALAVELALAFLPAYLLFRRFRPLPPWVYAYGIGLVAYQVHALADYTLWLHKISFVYWFYAFSLWYMYARLRAEVEGRVPYENRDGFLLSRES